MRQNQSRSRNHKPQDLHVCVERLHTDGQWRLVFTNTLYSDPAYNCKVTSVPDFDVRTDQLLIRQHNLLCILTGIETEQNQNFIKSARLRKEVKPYKPYPLEESDALILDPNPALTVGLPKDVGDWHQGPNTLPWIIKDWYHITWPVLEDEKHLTKYRSLPGVGEWMRHATHLLKTLPFVKERPQCTFGSQGLPADLLSLDEPFEAASSHERLKGAHDWNNLLPNSPKTTRLILGVD